MSFLSVIVDCNVANWGQYLDKFPNDAEKKFQNILSSVAAFCNAHMLSSLNNRLILLAGGMKDKNKKLFSNELDFSPTTNAIQAVEASLRDAILKSTNTEDPSTTSSCYGAAVALSICAYERYNKEFFNPIGRIVIINLAADLSNEQNTLMNLFFSANQHSMEVDVAFLTNPVPILQQACDITSGTHMIVDTPHRLIQYLMQNCLGGSRECRDAFSMWKEEDIDYRTTCHCHNKLVNIGWVCSVCLSVHCQFQPFCATCNVVFSLPAGQKRVRKRKKDE
ncbi:transcription factor tfb4 domain-containing protein [Ditylenchus destructor]|nr:transcription factor tfb4 domain-containing protein [Ditylenchus destructor]